VVIDRLLRAFHPRAGSRWITGVQVPIVVRECARGVLHANSMASTKRLTGVPKVDVVGVDSARLDQRLVTDCSTESRANHAIGEALSEAVGPHVQEFGDEIRVVRRA